MSPDDSEVAPSLLRAMIREQVPKALWFIHGVGIFLNNCLMVLCFAELQNMKLRALAGIKHCSSVPEQFDGLYGSNADLFFTGILVLKGESNGRTKKVQPQSKHLVSREEHLFFEWNGVSPF